MKKNFDTDRAARLGRDRSFTINGHEFTHRPAVAPEDVREWSAMVGGEHVLTDDNGRPVLSEPTPARDGDGNLIVRGGVLADLDQSDGPSVKVLRNAEVTMLPGGPISTLTEDDAIKILDNTVLAFLEPGQEEQWKEARDQVEGKPKSENPINLDDLRALVRWLFEETAARPTGPSSGSSGSTRGNANAAPATGSTESSPTPVVAAVA